MRSATMCFLYFFMSSWVSSAIPHHPTIHEPLSSGTEPDGSGLNNQVLSSYHLKVQVWKVNACASFFSGKSSDWGLQRCFE